jgi:2-polyprenyl-3-methyl-5-hydroxy-6-metoxy-1,4-benzoquinol methylase
VNSQPLRELDDAVAEGHYARKQLLCSNRLIAWSHRRRYATALELGGRFAGQTVLDYGCGDGTFLAMLMRSERPPAHAVGAELSAEIVRDCRDRFREVRELEFVLSAGLRKAHPGGFDAIVAMEVLEHVTEPGAMLDLFAELLIPGGELLVSVPVEIGPPVLIKQSVRRIAGWCGHSGYRETSRYRLKEMAASLFAGERQHIARPVYGSGQGEPWHDHKGFNWKVLRNEIGSRFTLDQVITSPIRWLPPLLSSQVWFIARKAR